jgi:hypothetical protein
MINVLYLGKSAERMVFIIQPYTHFVVHLLLKIRLLAEPD